MNPEDDARRRLFEDIGVSRETFCRLERYAELLRKWNSSLNLVSGRTLDAVWSRHFLDSAQLLPLASKRSPETWADLGSGGGFPGMVAAMLALDQIPGLCVSLIESNSRKCAFLENVSRETSTSVRVVNSRAEDMDGACFDIVSARAVAPLQELLPLASHLLRGRGVCLFLKGRGHASEVADARRTWEFSLSEFPSLTDREARILEIECMSRSHRG